MKRFCKPVCPYCGQALNYAQAWVIKRRGEYICPKCGGLSNVTLNSLTYTLGFFAIAVGIACFAVGLIFDSSLAVFTFSGILLVFLLFFLVSPLLVRLRKPARPKPRPRGSVPRNFPPTQ